jgi:hypothetical protein
MPQSLIHTDLSSSRCDLKGRTTSVDLELIVVVAYFTLGLTLTKFTKLAMPNVLLTYRRVLILVQVVVCFRLVHDLGTVLRFVQCRFNDTEQLQDRPIKIQVQYSHSLAYPLEGRLSGTL